MVLFGRVNILVLPASVFKNGMIHIEKKEECTTKVNLTAVKSHKTVMENVNNLAFILLERISDENLKSKLGEP